MSFRPNQRLILPGLLALVLLLTMSALLAGRPGAEAGKWPDAGGGASVNYQDAHPVQVTAVTDTAITIAWQADPNRSEYRIIWWVMNEPGFQDDFTTQTTYTITGLQPDTAYGLRVAHFAADYLQVTTLAQPTTPATPTPTPTPTPEISVAGGAGVTEGGDAVFTITASPAPSADLTVNVAVSASGDYGVSTGSQTVTVDTGGTATLTVTTTDDGVDEPHGSVTATLVVGSSYTVSTSHGSATVAVSDDDDPPPAGAYTAPASLVADVRSYAAETHHGSEHVERWKRVLIGLGVETYPGLTAMTAAEAQGYADQGWGRWVPVAVELQKAEAAQNSPPPTPVMLISGGAGVSEGGDAVFTITASPPPSTDLTVNVTVAQQGAYVLGGGQVVTGPRKVVVSSTGAATLTIPTLDDRIDEPHGSITATLDAGDGYAISAARGTATVSVTDDDLPAPPAVSIIPGPGVTEGDVVVFTLTADPTPSAPLNVSVKVLQKGGYADAGVSTVTISATGTAILAIPTANDEVDEPDGWVVALLVAGDGYTTMGARSAATVTVADDDDATEPLTLGDAFVDSLEDAMARSGQSQGGSQPQFAAMLGGGGFQTQQLQNTTSVVYVVDDSGSMDGDWPEVRTALEQVRDESGVTNTKVALIAFGSKSTTLFGLTDHAAAPWDTALSGHTGDREYFNGLTSIQAFGGYRGGTWYHTSLAAAMDLLTADGASTQKIVFMTDAQNTYPAYIMQWIISAGIVVDTIYFGDRYIAGKSDLEKIATDTGGVYREVAKPSTGTTNDPAVTVRPLSEILPEKAASDTTTLYLIDNSLSLYPWDLPSNQATTISNAMKGVQRKVVGDPASGVPAIATARVGVALFQGYNELPDEKLYSPYEMRRPFRAGGDFARTSHTFMLATGSTDLDNALNEAYDDISAETGTTRRVVLMTDGITYAKPTTATLQKYIDAAICLDVVALAPHADRVYLKSLADTTGLCGEFYVAE